MNTKPESSPGKLERGIASLLLALVTVPFLAWAIANSVIQFLWLLAGLVVVLATVVYVAVWRRGFRWLFSRRALRFHAGLVLALFTLVVLFYTEESWRGRRAWAALQREAAAQGEALTFDSLASPIIPDDQNVAKAPGIAELLGLTNLPNAGWGFYHGTENRWPTANWTVGKFTDLVAWQSFVRHHAAHAVADDRRGLVLTFPATPEPQGPAADVLTALGKYETNLAKLQAASRRPILRFPLNYNRGFFVMEELRQPLEALRAAEHLLALRACAKLAQEGGGEAALQDVLLALRVAELLRDEPFEQVRGYRRGMLQFCLQPIWEGLTAHRWNETQLAAIQTQLEQVDLVADQGRTLRAEALSMMSLADQTLAFIKGQPSELARSRDATEPEGRFWGWMARTFYPVGWLYQDKVWIYRYYQRHSGPFAPGQFRDQRSKEWEDEVRSASDPFLVVLVIPRLREISTQSCRGTLIVQSFVRLAATACALERFRLAHADYPAALTDLVPTCLAQAPADLFSPTGASLKYQRVPDGGFQLYSVGFDQADDGGKQDPVPELQLNHWRFNENGPDVLWPAPKKRPARSGTNLEPTSQTLR